MPTVDPPADKGPPPVQVTLESVGLDGAALDKSVSPCDDFYQFACGGWLKSTEIPADEATWVRSFSEIDKRNEVALKTILEDAGKAKNADPTTKKIGDFYAACMDEAAVDAAGIRFGDALEVQAQGQGTFGVEAPGEGELRQLGAGERLAWGRGQGEDDGAGAGLLGLGFYFDGTVAAVSRHLREDGSTRLFDFF